MCATPHQLPTFGAYLEANPQVEKLILGLVHKLRDHGQFQYPAGQVLLTVEVLSYANGVRINGLPNDRQAVPQEYARDLAAWVNSIDRSLRNVLRAGDTKTRSRRRQLSDEQRASA